MEYATVVWHLVESRWLMARDVAIEESQELPLWGRSLFWQKKGIKGNEL